MLVEQEHAHFDVGLKKCRHYPKKCRHFSSNQKSSMIWSYCGNLEGIITQIERKKCSSGCNMHLPRALTNISLQGQCVDKRKGLLSVNLMTVNAEHGSNHDPWAFHQLMCQRGNYC